VRAAELVNPSLGATEPVQASPVAARALYTSQPVALRARSNLYLPSGTGTPVHVCSTCIA
jgi:hypothetical protein